MLLQMCAEKFNRAPEECPHIKMDTIWEHYVLAVEESEEINKR